MITIIPIEPLSEEHGMLIVEAFNKHFVNRGGQEDGHGCGYGGGRGYGNGIGYGYDFDYCDCYGGERPEEWMII
jgi:hypothetical protein